MKRLHWVVITCVFFGFGSFFLPIPDITFATQNDQEERNNICFIWAFGAIAGDQSNPELVSIAGDTTLKTGDRFKMLVELKKRCFVYLIYRDSNDEIHMLFPNGTQQFINDYKIQKKYYIPQGDQWFELDKNVGLETFYLLVSAKRLPELEVLLILYKSKKSPERSELAHLTLQEIHRLIKQHRRFAAAAERPITIGGSVRGMEHARESSAYDIANIAIEISATEFYSRTFTIEHK